MTIQEILDKSFEDFKAFCDERHNIYVNQFYDKGLTYSFHTDVVLLQGLKFLHLITGDVDKFIVKCGLKGHDLIEDGRMSYNDIKKVIDSILIKNGLYNEKLSLDEIANNPFLDIPKKVAEVVFLTTDEKGRDRDERKPISLYNELVEDKLAVFVKISDIIGNVKFGLLTNNPKAKTVYKKEWQEKQKAIIHKGTQKLIFPADNGSIYQEMLDYLDAIFELV